MDDYLIGFKESGEKYCKVNRYKRKLIMEH